MHEQLSVNVGLPDTEVNAWKTVHDGSCDRQSILLIHVVKVKLY